MPIQIILMLLLTIILAACEKSSPPDVVAPAAVIGAFVADGPVESRELSPTIERVPNCGGSNEPVIRHPSLALLTTHEVEWEVGGHMGVGLNIGNGPIPGGVNLNAAFDTNLSNSAQSGIEQAIAWDLPADPNTIIEYTLTWHEVWQPGYVDVQLADGSTNRVRILYRTGLKSDIIDAKVLPCGIEGSSPPAIPTVEQVIPEVSHQQDLIIGGQVVTPDSLALIVGGDAAFWSERGSVVWAYWDEGHNVTFHHPGDNMVLSYWAGFLEPRNASDCQIVIQDNTRFVKCPPGTQAEFEADGIGLHIIDYTGLFP